MAVFSQWRPPELRSNPIPAGLTHCGLGQLLHSQLCEFGVTAPSLAHL